MLRDGSTLTPSKAGVSAHGRDPWSESKASGKRQPLPEAWDAPSYVLNRENVDVKTRQLDAQRDRIRQGVEDDEHAANQRRTAMIAARKQATAERMLGYVDGRDYQRQARTDMHASLVDQQADQQRRQEAGSVSDAIQHRCDM
jgi:hypothetical protein